MVFRFRWLVIGLVRFVWGLVNMFMMFVGMLEVFRI